MVNRAEGRRAPTHVSPFLLAAMVLIAALLPLLLPICMCPVCEAGARTVRDCRWCDSRGKVSLFRKWYGTYLLSQERG
jgi:hypothetical protein